MSEPVTFTTQLTFEDYLAANRTIALRAWSARELGSAWLKFMAIVVVIVVCALLLKGRDPLQDLRSGLLPLAAFGVFWLGLCFAIQWLRIPKLARKTYDQLGSVDLPVAYALSPERFEACDAQGSSIHTWAQFMDWIETDRLLILRRTQMLFFGIPKVQLDAAKLTAIRGLLNSVGVKQT